MFKEGWTWLANSTKWHYFINGRSFCGRWMLFSTPTLKQGNDESPDNCRSCKEKLEKRKKKMPEEFLEHLKLVEKNLKK